MRILIAEDDISSRALLKHILAKWGYEVVVTKDGNEAWEALQAEDAPRLAILDWMMPGMDGVEVCRKVRQLDVSNPTYIILLTIRSSKKDIVAGLEAGADDYIGKPYETDELRFAF
jgi:DNA-binding response OmpR family regulator